MSVNVLTCHTCVVTCALEQHIITYLILLHILICLSCILFVHILQMSHSVWSQYCVYVCTCVHMQLNYISSHTSSCSIFCFVCPVSCLFISCKCHIVYHLSTVSMCLNVTHVCDIYTSKTPQQHTCQNQMPITVHITYEPMWSVIAWLSCINHDITVIYPQENTCHKQIPINIQIAYSTRDIYDIWLLVRL